GGFLITPLLIFTGIPPIIAVSSGATQMAGTAAGASYIQWRQGTIDFRMALVLLAGSWLGGGVGGVLANTLGRRGGFGNVVVLLYVILLGFVGISMLFESLRAIARAREPVKSTPETPRTGLMRSVASSLPFEMRFGASGAQMSVLVPLVLGVFVGMLTSL